VAKARYLGAAYDRKFLARLGPAASLYAEHARRTKIIDEILSWPGIFAYILLVIGSTFVFAWAAQRLYEIEIKEQKAEHEKENAVYPTGS
jgi:ABC-type Na+ efflux pump permease subunit